MDYLSIKFVSELKSATELNEALWHSFKNQACVFGYWDERHFLLCEYESVEGTIELTFNEVDEYGEFYDPDNIIRQSNELYTVLSEIYKLAREKMKVYQ